MFQTRLQIFLKDMTDLAPGLSLFIFILVYGAGKAGCNREQYTIVIDSPFFRNRSFHNYSNFSNIFREKIHPTIYLILTSDCFDLNDWNLIRNRESCENTGYEKTGHLVFIFTAAADLGRRRTMVPFNSKT